MTHVRHLSSIWKVVLGFWLTDEVFAVAIARYLKEDSSKYKHWYYIGAAIFIYCSWQISTLLGLTLGHSIPNITNWGLDFAMSVTLIGMVIPYVKNRSMAVTVFVSGITAMLTRNFPYQSNLIVASIAGITAGMLFQRINI